MNDEKSTIAQEQGQQQTEQKHKRPIRSYVMRSGRMTPSQEKAYEQSWKTLGLDVSDGALDTQVIFGRSAPLVLEIGFGMGDSLIEMAANAPEQDFIGVEVHRAGVGRALNLARKRELNNIRFYCTDAIDVLKQCIADGQLQRVQLYFPDPWHKKKHNKRRIVNENFAQLVRQKLALGGCIHMATDWEPYAEHMMEVMTAAQGFSNDAGKNQFIPRPDYRPETKFERRGERLGHGVWDLVFNKDS